MKKLADQYREKSQAAMKVLAVSGSSSLSR